ncbi:MAG: hypothetical protein V1725_01875 [archaeon]
MIGTWTFQETMYCIGGQPTPALQKKHKCKHVKTYTEEAFFTAVMDYERQVFLSIRDGDIVQDNLNLLKLLRKNIKNGVVLGTKEMLFRKLMNIRESMREVERIKKEFFDNIYTSCLEAAQAALLLKGKTILVPRKVPDLLEKEYANQGLERTSIVNCRTIIETFKKVEHGKTTLPKGKELDELAKKCALFREAVRKVKT